MTASVRGAEGDGTARSALRGDATPASAFPPTSTVALFQTFSPGGRLDDAEVRRHRPGAGDIEASGGADGWQIGVESEAGEG